MWLARQGTWVYGKRHGNGSYTYHDGGKYEGEWVDDKVGWVGVSWLPVTGFRTGRAASHLSNPLRVRA